MPGPAQRDMPTSSDFALRRRFALWAFIYALAILYGSLAVGPLGFHFVALDPDDAWHSFLAMPYEEYGADEHLRADYMANLLMLVPLGFFTAGSFWRRQGAWRQALAIGLALGFCLSFLLAVKYAQLFFPPRTVSLNYVIAQSVGSLLGVGFFLASQKYLISLGRGIAAGGRRTLVILLGIYATALILFFWFPFDFVMNFGDLRERLSALPQLVFSWPGEGRPTFLRLILVLFDTAVTAPLGMLLVLVSRWRSPVVIAAAGLVTMAAVTGTAMLILSATPFLAAIAYRTAGICIGAGLTLHLEHHGIGRVREWLIRLVPLLVLPYVLMVVLLNGLATARWQSASQALASFDLRGLMPFWNHYIVSKGQAAQSVVLQAAMYAPIGVMVALRRGSSRNALWLAATVAFGFSLMIEAGRGFKPGLQPDISNTIVAAVAAALAVKLMPLVWRALESLGGEASSPRELSRAAATLPAATIPIPGDTVSRTAIGRYAAAGRALGAAACLLIALGIIARYPLGPWLLVGALALYGAVLWRWPVAWLVVIPAVLPAVDLTPWTGWMYVTESDLFVLVTLAVLLLRAPPTSADLLPAGIARVIVALVIMAWGIGVVRGLALDLAPAAGSSNPYLRPDNALRLAKGLLVALALLPFLRHALRTRHAAMIWFGAGMMAGLTLVAAAAMTERLIFTGLFDFDSDYRVVATFSSMHVGGGHIGAYIALALPFLAICLLRLRPLPFLTMTVVGCAASYALLVTFARTAYVAALLAVLVLGIGWMIATLRRSRTRLSGIAIPLLVVFAIAGSIVAGALGTDYMRARLDQLLGDAATRESNWIGGLHLRNDDTATGLFGMGLGTYPRVLLARSPTARAATNFVIEHEAGRSYLSIEPSSPTYIDQKLLTPPDRGPYALSLDARSPTGSGSVHLLLCQKLLLYSGACRGPSFTPKTAEVWESFSTTIPTDDLALHSRGIPRRLVGLSLWADARMNITNIRLRDSTGRDVLDNGNFAEDMTRWYFTDDHHPAWRILNQYLMTLFEEGIVGLAIFVALMATALAGAWSAIRRGDRMGAVIAASLVAILCSCVSDAELEAPRLAALYYLTCFVGLTMGRPTFGN